MMLNGIRATPLAVCAMLALAGNNAAAQVATDVPNGIDALVRHDIRGAVREFSKAASSASPSIAAAGEQWLAHVSWTVHGNAVPALAHLTRALALARDSSMLLLERARLDGFQHRYRDAVHWAAEGMMRAVDAERRGLIARTLIALAVDGSYAGARSHARDSVHLIVLRPVRDTLRARVGRFPGRTEDAQALLSAGILLSDADAIEMGWESYYALINDAAAQALDSARALLHRGTAAMRLNPESEAAWRNIATGLAASRLYDATGLLVRAGRPAKSIVPPDLRDAASYAEFLRALRASTEEYYRRALVGGSREGDLDRAINARTRSLWTTLRWPSPPPPFFPAAVPGELARRFGTVMIIDRGVPIPEIHLAHAIASFPPAGGVESPGPRPVQVLLDGLAANGLDAWLLDGAGGRAGWASGDSIFEVRTSFTEAPFRSFVALADPQSMPNELLRVYRDSVADIERARRDSVGYFASIAARVFRSGASVILDSLYAQEMPQADRQRSFVQIMYRQLTFTSITLHESRHLADEKATPRRSAADGEFRAKVDEVTGSRRPRLAMTAILAPTIGAQSAHGEANRRIMLALARWIRANGAAIAGYDGSVPALLQLPNLTDAQLIAAFRSMRTN